MSNPSRLALCAALLVVGCQPAEVTTQGGSESGEVASPIETKEATDSLTEYANCGPVLPEHVGRYVFTPVFGRKVYTSGFDIVPHADPNCRLDIDSIDRGIQRAIDRWLSRGYAIDGLMNAVNRITEIHIMEDYPAEGIAATRISWSGTPDNFSARMFMPLNPIYPGTTSPYPVFCNVMGHELDHEFAYAVNRPLYQSVGHSTDISGIGYSPEQLSGGIPAYGSWCAPPAPVPVNVSGRVYDQYGRGAYGVYLTMTRADGSYVAASRSNSFGYFRFFQIPTGETYTINVKHRYTQYAPVSLQVTGEVNGLVILPL
jgi:hypothetical protein